MSIRFISTIIYEKFCDYILSSYLNFIIIFFILFFFYLLYFKAAADTKTLADVGNLLITSGFAWLSKDSGSILNTPDTKPRTTQQRSLNTPYTLELDLGPTGCRSLISSRMTYSAVCCMCEKNVSSYKLHMNPSMIANMEVNS